MQPDRAAAILDFLAVADRLKDARFAMACDRMQGFLQNVLSGAVFATLIGRLYDRAEEARLLGPAP